MKPFNILHALFMLVSGLIQAQESIPQPIPDEYIVTIRESVVAPIIQSATTDSDDRTQRFQQAEAARRDATIRLNALRAGFGVADTDLRGQWVDATVAFAAKLTPAQVESIRRSPNVEQVDQNFSFVLEVPVVENDAAEMIPDGQTTPCAITNAGGKTDGSGKMNYIWILDTGIDMDHPDLNVVSDPAFAKSFILGETTEDGHGHGTHVAGIAAAKDNTIGTVGVSAGAKVVPLKVMSNGGSGSSIGVISALNHVAQKFIPNDVVNMSLGSTVSYNCENSSAAYRNAIRNLGKKRAWVCIAAGNESCDAAKSRPGCINGERVFTVGAMTCQKKCSSISNWNSAVVDWVATGEKVYSTYKNGTYKTLSGTSMATPVVAGICHARQAAPVSNGTISCGNTCVPAANYPIARH